MASGDSLKQRIRDGEIVIGVSAPMTSSKSQLEEILSKDTYGFVAVDSQHSPFSEDRLVEFCSIAKELDIPVQLRIKHTRHTYMLGNLLDLGPLALEVPQVEEESTMEHIVARLKLTGDNAPALLMLDQELAQRTKVSAGV